MTEKTDRYQANPPEFDGSEEGYKEWLPLLAMWLTMTQLPKSKQGMTIVLTLKGRTRTIAANLNIHDRSQETLSSGLDVGLGRGEFPLGVIHLIQALNDGGFLQSKHMLSFSTLEDFISIQGGNYRSIQEYTTAFSSKYNKAKFSCNLAMDDGSVAMLMLLRSGIPKEDFAKVMSHVPSTSLTPSTMKSTLHWLYPAIDPSKIHAKEEVLTTTVPFDPAGEDEYLDLLEETTMDSGEQAFISRRMIVHSTNGFGYRRGARQPARPGKFDLSRIQCHGCRQFGHFVRNCPSKSFLAYLTGSGDSVIQNLEVCTAFATEELEDVLLSFPPALRPCAILDSACTSSVMGSAYLKQLRSQFPFSHIHQQPSSKVFQFGKTTKAAFANVVLPIIIEGRSGYLSVQVVQDDPGEVCLPLLLSKTAMARLEVKMAFQNDTGSILGHQCKFQMSRHGHYVLPFILGTHRVHEVCDTATLFTDSDDSVLLRKELSSLHVRFGHPTAERLLSFLERSSVTVSPMIRELISSITKSCKCQDQRQPSRPTRSALPLATTFNDVLTIDIMILEDAKVLKIVDMFTRYSIFVQLPAGSSEHVLQALCRYWFRYFGHPRMILSDKGSENIGRCLVSYAESLSIDMKYSASHSPESMGLCERIGGIIRSTVVSMRRDPNHSRARLQDVLDAATTAHNNLSHIGGFTPMQLVVGVSARLPSILTEHLSAASKAISRDRLYVDRVLVLHSARIAYTQAENDDRLHRALLTKKFGDFSLDYCVGDRILYFDHDKLGHGSLWHGPVTVVGVNPEAKELILMSGRSYFSRHMSRCRLHSEVGNLPSSIEPVEDKQASIPTSSDLRPINDEFTDEDSRSDKVSKDSSGRVALFEEGSRSDENSIEGSVIDDIPEEDSTNDELTDESTASEAVDENSGSRSKSDNWRVNPQHPDAFKIHPLPNLELKRSDRSRKPTKLFEAGMKIEDSDADNEITYLSQNEVLQIKREVPSEDQGSKFEQAKRDEIEKLISFDTFEVVQQSECRGSKIIDSRFVCTWKPVLDTQSGTDQSETGCGMLAVPRARLVVKGFQEELSVGEVTDAPTASREGARLVALKAAQEGWDIISLDVQAAFLQSELRTASERDVYVRPPKDSHVPPNTIWKLKRSLYGLRSAPAAWWYTFSKVLTEHNLIQCANDVAVFVLRDENGSTCGIVALHVDDVLATGNAKFLKVLDQIKIKVKFGKEQRNNFIHTGIRYRKTESGISMDQQLFIQNLKPIDLLPSSVDRPLTEKEYDTFRALLGSLMWCASTTRPDISTNVSRLSAVASKPSIQHYNQVEKLRRYMMATSHEGLFYGTLKGNLQVVAFSDAAFQNLNDGGSQGGFLISVAEQPESRESVGLVNCALISWKSGRIRRVVRSTFAAETLQCGTTFDHGARVRDLFDDMFRNQKRVPDIRLGRSSTFSNIPTDMIILTDCQSIIDHLRSLRNACTEKRLEKEIYLMKDAILSDELLRWQHVPSEFMMADGMTKDAPKLKEKIILGMRGKLIHVPQTKTNHFSREQSKVETGK